MLAEHLEHRPRTPPAARQPQHRGSELGPAQLGEVLDGGDDEVVLGREVVQLGAPADPGPLGDQGGRRAGEASLDEQLDRRLQQPGAHGAAPVCLGDADGGHDISLPSYKQTVKPDFLVG